MFARDDCGWQLNQTPDPIYGAVTNGLAMEIPEAEGEYCDPALTTLRSFYQWLHRSNGYPINQLLPTDAIDLERQPNLQADHIKAEDLSQLWAVLELEERTRVSDR